MNEPLPVEAARIIEDELTPGEKLVWCAQPHSWAFAKAAIPVFLFGLVFFGFSIFWETMALTTTQAQPKNGAAPPAVAVVFPLFGVPFVLVGLCMVLSPLGYVLKAKRTVYGLTDKAAIVMRGQLLGGREVTRFGPQQLDQISRRDSMGGRGDLIFQYVNYGNWRSRNGTPVMRPDGFIGIDNVRDVERLLRATLLGG
jgi:hypothetical protein